MKPPGTDAAGLRTLARKWVSDGLAFVGPLLDESQDVPAAIAGLQPHSEFEKQLVSVLRLAIGQQ